MDRSSLDIVEILIGLIGGLALFLYGMQKMSEGLKAAAGERMRSLLARLTTNRFTAAISGALVTAVIQSSSVTTVLAVGFISAGLMTLGQSVGVIMGANVGTTVTAQIVAFQVTRLAWVMLAAGFAMWSFPRRDALRQYGALLMGLGLLFLGMEQMSEATGPLRSYPPFIELMGRMHDPLLGILLGAAFTALVQSSSATTGIVVMLASQGFLSLEAGIALAVGANIGTCFTAILSAIGKPTDAVRAAVVHVLFNVVGAALWIGLIPWLAELARVLSPAAEGLAGVERLAAETPRQIANANTIFNVANTVLLIGFTGPIARLAERIVPARPEPPPRVVTPKYLDPVYLETPAIAIDRLRMELVHMGQYVRRMLQVVPATAFSGDEHDPARLAAMDDDVDRLHRAILRYARDLGRGELGSSEIDRLEAFVAIANYLESTGDLIATNIAIQSEQRLRARIEPESESREVGRPLWNVVGEMLDEVLQAIRDDDAERARRVSSRKAEIHAMTDRAIERLGLLAHADRIDIEELRISTDVLGQLKRLYYNVRKIADIVAARGERSTDG